MKYSSQCDVKICDKIKTSSSLFKKSFIPSLSGFSVIYPSEHRKVCIENIAYSGLVQIA